MPERHMLPNQGMKTTEISDKINQISTNFLQINTNLSLAIIIVGNLQTAKVAKFNFSILLMFPCELD